MSFQVSPGVQVREVDLTGFIPAVSTSIGAYAGHFRWGPVDETVLIGDEKQLARNFGTPTPMYAASYYAPSTFLRYGNRLYVSRAGDADMQNARSGDLAQLNTDWYTDPEGEYADIENIDDIVAAFAELDSTNRIENKSVFDSITAGNLNSNIYARCLGEMGDSIKVMVQPAYNSSRWNVVKLEVVSHNESLAIDITVRNQKENGEWTKSIDSGSQVSLRGIASSLDWVNYIEQLGRKFYVDEVDTFTDTTDGYGQTQFGIADMQYSVYRLYIDRATTIAFNPLTVYQADEFGRTFIQDEPFPGQEVFINDMSQGFLYWPPEAEDFEAAFVAAPGTSAFAEKHEIKNDEVHILIVDAEGDFTGTPGTILETYNNLSLLADAKNSDGSTAYYKDVINESSRYIFFNTMSGIITNADMTADAFINIDAAFENSAGFGAVYAIKLAHGADGIFSNGNVYQALTLFEDPEEIDINLLFAENDTNDNITIANKLITIAERRKDCVAFVSPDLAVKDQSTETAKLDRVLRKFNRLPSTSYAVFDSTPIKVYDKYNDQYIWTTASGTVAGLCARTDSTRDPWWSPAGYSRGQLLGVAKVAFNPKQAARDELYKARVNPIVSFPGEGTILFGDKTAQTRPSAFDRINVRRLFIVLQKAIATAAKYSLFEFNDEFTRAQFVNMVDPYLRDVQGRRGIYDFRVVCDETNNTGEIIDSNRFVADIYIKPARAINFITLNFVATRTGVEFDEIIGQF